MYDFNHIRFVTLERAIVDCIDKISLAGGLEEVSNALENISNLDAKLLVEILDYYSKASLYQKVGYLLEEKLGKELPSWFYKHCYERRGNKVFYFDTKVGKGKLNLKWRLIVPNTYKEIPNELYEKIHQ